MDDEDRFAGCAGLPLLLDWRIDRHLFITFEIETDAAEALLPPPLEIVELRPSVALLSIGVLRYEPGNFGPDSPGFFEVVTALHVAADLSLPMPLPKMNFYALSVYSDSVDFVEQESRTLFTPSTHVPSLEVEFTADGLGVDLADARGPIFSYRNGHPSPQFTAAEFWGQHYTTVNGLHQGIWEWDGRRFEHMRRTGEWKLHPHPMFGEVDVDRLGGCYRQMMLEPGTGCRERFYAMRPFGSR